MRAGWCRAASVLAVAVGVAVMAIAGGCGASGDGGGADAAEPHKEKLTNVRTETIQRTVFTRSAVYSGGALPVRSVTVSAETGGKIVDLRANEGDEVKAGARLAKVDTRLAGHQVEQAKANVMATKDRVDRLTALQAADLATPQDLEQATAQLAAARAALSLATTQKGMAAIDSPVHAIVTRRYKEPGEYVGPGAPLYDLADLWELKVVVDVPEDRIRFIKEGDTAKVTVDALPGLEPKTGTVHHVGYVGDTQNRTYPVEIRIQNPDLQIRANMLTRVTFTELELPGVVVVERDAIVDGRNGKVVYVVSDGVAMERPVELGPDSSGQVLVAGGLVPGEDLIVEGQRQVTDGEKVRVVAPEQDETLRAAAADKNGESSP